LALARDHLMSASEIFGLRGQVAIVTGAADGVSRDVSSRPRGVSRRFRNQWRCPYLQPPIPDRCGSRGSRWTTPRPPARELRHVEDLPVRGGVPRPDGRRERADRGASRLRPDRLAVGDARRPGHAAAAPDDGAGRQPRPGPGAEHSGQRPEPGVPQARRRGPGARLPPPTRAARRARGRSARHWTTSPPWRRGSPRLPGCSPAASGRCSRWRGVSSPGRRYCSSRS
jgi:hypothetical protein